MKHIDKIEDIEVEIRRAIVVLKALPKVGPKKLSAYWPDYVSDYEDEEEVAFMQPMADEIADMDIVFEKWLKILDIDERRLVIYRCEGECWQSLMKKFNMSRSAVYNRYVRDIHKIYNFVIEEQMQNKKENKSAVL